MLLNIPRRTLLGGALLIALFVVNVAITYVVFTKPFPGFNDFLTPWEASHAFFYDGLDPYSEETSLRIQTRIYGRAALPDEQPNHFAYPFYTLFFVYPTIHFDYSLATAIWVVILEACLVGAVLLLLDIYRWKPRPFTVAMLILFSILCYPGARGLILGQVSHLVYFLQVLGLWAVIKRHDRVAGVALACATFKPQMVIVFVPLLVLWALVQRRGQLLAAFGVTMAVLVAASFALLPNWVSGFWQQLTLYPTYIEVSTPAWVITDYWLGLGQSAEVIVNVIVYAAMLWTWYKLLIEQRHERFLWTVMLTLTVTHLVGLRTASPHFIVLMMPLLFYLRPPMRSWQVGAVLFGLWLIPWVHFLTTIGESKFEHPSTFLFLPLLTLLALIVSRRQWWAWTPTTA